MDALPLYMIKSNDYSKTGMNYFQVSVTRPFKYIRYVSPNGQASLTGFEVYGVVATTTNNNEDENVENVYQLTNIPLISIHTDGKINFRKKANKTTCNIIVIDKGKINQNKGN